MNQITRCPNCSTSFRVTDDQLAAHQGKVRCGRCSFIFNARDFLQRIDPELIADTTKTDPIPDTRITTEAQPVEEYRSIPDREQHKPLEETTYSGSTEHEAVAINHDTEVNGETASASNVINFPTAAPKPDSEGTQDNEKDLQRALAKLVKKTRSQKIRRTRKPSRRTIEPTAMSALAEEELNPEQSPAQSKQEQIENDAEYRPILDDTDPLFMEAKPSRWRWLWAVGSLLLSMALVLQLSFNFRLELSQEFPALRPKWQALCAKLGCDMPLPRQADLLRSEWSELTYIPDHPTLVQVKATLRNLAPFEQAMPKLELTLTDENERLVARKIFSAKEYLAQSEPNQASLLANDEVHAFLQLDLGQLHSTGYSIYWFYE
ncbi:DUF3426 domain-containing protein [Chitinibacter bivalviorum]|uniref:DUF3426 domain-containing protein n=1 Tax=Chitinibacter bivalviorum TaxID=2739434 RepID=A0A7H9BMZ4_9NEIS|nr:DUF3426 domain-containing protein [Chitinibacter bivalviorum]QLG89776.1 DUF3426 domain-containing protein [Chitinibacter bivalviorum]